MSTEQTKQSPIIPSTPPTVTRNGQSVTLVEQIFGKTSDNAGKRFWAPVLDVSKPEHVSWAVAENLNSVVNKNLRGIFGEIYWEAVEANTNEHGHLNEPAFVQQLEADWVDFTAGVAKLSDLEDQINDLQDQAGALIDDPNYQCEDPTDPTTWTPEYTGLAIQLRNLNARIKPLRQQHKAITEVYKERAAKRKAKAEKSKTQTAAPANVTQ